MPVWHNREELFLLGRCPMGTCGQFRLREKPEPRGIFNMGSGSYLYDTFFGPPRPRKITQPPKKSKKPKKKNSLIRRFFKWLNH